MNVKVIGLVVLIFGALIFGVGFTLHQDYQDWEEYQDRLHSQCQSQYTMYQSCEHILNSENPRDSGIPYMTIGGIMMVLGLSVAVDPTWD